MKLFSSIKKGADNYASAPFFDSLNCISAQLEEQVKRAESHNGCKREDHGNDEKYNAECACYDAAEIQIGEQNCEQGTDDSVGIGHVAFHKGSPLVDWFDASSIGDYPLFVCDIVT